MSLLSIISDINFSWWWILGILVLLVIIRDIFFNPRHTITHNFPIIGHFRYLLEKIGPELRQYIVANNREELPFNRSERSWIYASAKKENNYAGFGTDQDIHAPNYHFIKPNLFPFIMDEGHYNLERPDFVPCAKVIGLANKRKRPYRPASVINISAMSYGSLSAAAVESLNKGAKRAGCYHNTGEGGLSPHHSHGADVVFHFGTGYFGVRDGEGNFSIDNLEKLVENNPFVRAIEIKLSQGAKPGKGGVLPAGKITSEIAAIRGVERGRDVISPAFHTAFSGVDEMLDLIEQIAGRTGLPVGIKSAVGRTEQWDYLATKMKQRGTGPDFITIDGGEGGTGAAPPSFANHVSLPFFYAFSTVYEIFLKHGLTDRIVWIASGKLGLPAQASKAFAMGADLVNVAREAMMSIGCIQAQICHTNRCPSGVATQNKWLQAGINVPLKSERFAEYAKAFRKEIRELAMATGHEHPCQFSMTDIEVSMGDSNYTKTLKDIFGYEKHIVHFDGVEKLRNCPYLGATGYEYHE
ncbi:MAG: FMN-binding glutamate synthase family protein [Flavobacteriales bacterium]|nr:FMN-binding glutamate synthase family protein [Flavobacteriales bacterium]